MKASKFSDAQKAFISPAGRRRRSGRRHLPESWDQPGDLFQLEEDLWSAPCRQVAIGNEPRGLHQSIRPIRGA
jgi:hypothetical protein